MKFLDPIPEIHTQSTVQMLRTNKQDATDKTCK